MTQKLILSTILMLVLLSQAPSQIRTPRRVEQVPVDVPPIPAGARLCGNQQVREHEKPALMAAILAEGCNNVTFEHIGEGWWLGYGTRVLIGEVGE